MAKKKRKRELEPGKKAKPGKKTKPGKKAKSGKKARPGKKPTAGKKPAPKEKLEGLISDVARDVKELSQKVTTQAQITRDSVKDVPGAVIDIALDEAEKRLLEPITGGLDKLFRKLGKPLTEFLSPVLELLQLARVLKDDLLDVERRLDHVQGTMTALFPNVGGPFKELAAAVKGLLAAEPRELPRAYLRFVRALLGFNPAVRSARWVVKCALHREIELLDEPAGFSPGQLYEFLNAKGLSRGEREFRLELLTALDQYFRREAASLGRPDGAGLAEIAGSVDSKQATRALTDLVGILVETTLGYLFRPVHLPSRIAPRVSLLRPAAEPSEIAARDASLTLSRSLSQPIHGLSGLVLRGFWEVNTLNEALVEVVASGIKSVVAGLAESILHSVLSSVELREVYGDPQARGKRENHLWAWETGQRWGDGGVVFQEVVVGDGVPKRIRAELATKLRGLIEKDESTLFMKILKDYGTYLEVARVGHEPDLSDSSIGVSLKPADAGGVDVTARPPQAISESNIVLRAYAAGRVQIMDPAEEGSYRTRLDRIGRDRQVHVLAGLSLHGASSLAAGA